MTKSKRECVDCGAAIPPPAIGAGNPGTVCVWCLLRKRDQAFRSKGEVPAERP
jgi:hypothetical protein